jgi:hypothetical protein
MAGVSIQKNFKYVCGVVENYLVDRIYIKTYAPMSQNLSLVIFMYGQYTWKTGAPGVFIYIMN